MIVAGQQNNPGISMAGAVDLGALKHKVEAEPGQVGGAPAAGAYVVDVTEGSFQAIVQTSATYPVLLFLWVPTDDRLFPMAKALGDAVNGLEGRIQLARIDMASYPSIAQALQVQGAPALIALIGGQPMPILQGLPQGDEMRQITDEVIPKLMDVAAQAGVSGTAPYAGDPADQTESDGDSGSAGAEELPPAHAEAHRLAAEGDYGGAAKAYEHLLETDPNDSLAQRERSKALLLARSGQANVRQVRERGAAHRDDVEAQLAVADIDMIGGQIEDAFNRLLDFLAGHKADTEAVRQRLLEYFAIPEPTDGRLQRARRRLATLMY
ncbi:co-chaperone YbbN [Bifidobacterium aemilianum]|uniref:Co-chaperone YbbN n=1 Tax=Bifidobacterium aemilianum TaxID=2493120 RepID=A0A366K957_9BIFI|nr:tetratricopeptide repeat protein [Bifidobacterium aemilianum]RBP97663.1 co-chaperone YbbN [Bifidobacterium aemilianum]